ncbi:unnamed protein product [Macrosiphum euphorbiae]|uniref:Uncharacterized protein n=1 Tax=Macrosiphum euphorbiae TaxID=13131 RepID=A0AAV0VQG5_9HEMI|nr:unnamed protein product [Macrosiphum euphorbiae]
MKALRPASRKSSSDCILARSHRDQGKSPPAREVIASKGSHVDHEKSSPAREVTSTTRSHREQGKSRRPREVIELEESPRRRSQQVRDGRAINRHTIFCRTVI